LNRIIKLIDSMPPHFQAVIRAKGFATKYQVMNKYFYLKEAEKTKKMAERAKKISCPIFLISV
jgi:hypothetical protein